MILNTVLSAFSELSSYGLAGILGVELYIGTYAAQQIVYLRGRGYSYAGLNLAASACVLISLSEEFNLSSAMIQICWISISAIGMVRYYLLSNHMHYTQEEKSMLADALAALPRTKTRKFLDLGVWIDAPAGTVLTVEGEPVQTLVYIATGRADVFNRGSVIAHCYDKTMIGELTVFSGEPATATVKLTEASRLFSVSALALRSQMRRDPELHASIESCFAVQMVEKLKRSSVALSERSAVADYG